MNPLSPPAPGAGPTTADAPLVVGAPPWARVYQVAVVVPDLAQAAAYYESLGIGPFREGPSAHTTKRLIRGVESPDTVVKGLIAPLGAIELELFEPVAGPSIQREFLERRGPGPIHLCAFTDDIDRDIAWMAERGTPVISYGELSDGGRFAYFDTIAIGGLVLELYQLGPDGEIIPTTGENQ
ncbi:VOC family protein [Pseudonocardia pini]|uniref:VOC family protein n=1 Tax=Pseudonocardia pini TaxID=2758030 RepID=UPI0015F0AF00|nr:VOC family protein [Pseudonocardia pini]